MATIGNAPVFPTESVLPGNLQVTGNATISGSSATVNGDEVRTLGTSGTVVQAVWSASAPDITFANTLSTSSFIHTGLSITPTSASNKILVTAAFETSKAGSNGTIDTNGYYFSAIFRGTTRKQEIGNATGYLSPENSRQYISGQDLDSPATTSSVTYYIKPYVVQQGTTNTFYIHRATLSLLEIVA